MICEIYQFGLQGTLLVFLEKPVIIVYFVLHLHNQIVYFLWLKVLQKYVCMHLEQVCYPCGEAKSIGLYAIG